MSVPGSWAMRGPQNKLHFYPWRTDGLDHRAVCGATDPSFPYSITQEPDRAQCCGRCLRSYDAPVVKEKPMKPIMQVLAVSFAAAALGACSHAGPFVKSIIPDGRGGATLEKCGLTMDPLSGVLRENKCTIEVVQLCPQVKP